MTPNQISRMRNANADNKTVLFLLAEIEILTRTVNLLQSKINGGKNVDKPSLSGMYVPRISEYGKIRRGSISDLADSVLHRENA